MPAATRAIATKGTTITKKSIDFGYVESPAQIRSHAARGSVSGQ
jgi:hypothetical protein